MEESKNFIKKEIDSYTESSLAQRKEPLDLVGAEKLEETGSRQNNLLEVELEKEKTRISDSVVNLVTGALNDNNDPGSIKRDKHAEMFYETRRNNGINAFATKISANTGLRRKMIESIFNHVFINEYEFGNSRHRFDPDYDMAESFRRLLEGKEIQEHDIILLKHEYLEFAIMKRLGYNHSKAHDLTMKKYNYHSELKKWENKNANTRANKRNTK